MVPDQGKRCDNRQEVIDYNVFQKNSWYFLDIRKHKVEKVRGDNEVWSLPDKCHKRKSQIRREVVIG